MIYKNSKVFIVDNSGVSVVRIIHIMKKGKNMLPGKVGHIAKASVQRLRKSIPKKRAKKGEVVNVLIVSVKDETAYRTGLNKRGSRNTAVILNKEQTGIISNRIVQPVDINVRSSKFIRIAALAPRVI